MDSKALIHPDPKEHIPALQKLVEAAWDMKTIHKDRGADEVTFSFTISRDKLTEERSDLFAMAIHADV